MKALLLSEEFFKMEQKLEKYKKEAKEFKEKSIAISEENEKTKNELEQAKELVKELNKKVDKKKIEESHSVEKGPNLKSCLPSYNHQRRL